MTNTNNQVNGCEPDEPLGVSFRWLIQDILKASVPTERLRKATAIAVDQTAFPTFSRVFDFRVQSEVDREVKEAHERGEELPDGIHLGADEKLVRCADPDARAGHRGASVATGHKARPFTGYHVATAVLVRESSWSGMPNKAIRGPKVPGYILGLSVDPASADPGPIGEQLVGDVLAIAPGIKEVLADRGFTQLPESFNRPLHQRGLDITMDYKSDMASVAKHVQVGTGTNRQRLITTQGMFFPTWLPHRFFTVPPGLSFSQRRDWYASRTKFRWSVHKRLPGGDIQFICPQCAGRVVTNLKTHKKNATPNKSAPFVHVPGSGTCCKGLATVPVDRLDHWQPIPWKTRAWRKRYPRRNQVENVNGMVREDGGLRAAFCRVKGLAAHTLSALALTVAHNLHLQITDPLANHTTDTDDVASNGDTADSHPPSEDAGASANPTTGTTGGLRAPP